MKIFFITSKLNFERAGGSVDEMDLMMRRLQAMGNDVTAVTVFSRANAIKEKLPYRVIEEDILSVRQLGIQWGAYKIFKKYSAQADVFQVDGHLLLYGAGLYRMFGGRVPILAFFNRELTAWPPNVSMLFRGAPKDGFLKRIKIAVRRFIESFFGMRIAGAIDFYTFTSPFLRKAYEDFGLKTAGKTYIFCDPYDFLPVMAQYHITPDAYAKRNRKDGRIVLFYSSRMAPGKGFDLLVSAFAKVRNKERFTLVLGGTGPEEPMVRKMIADLGIGQYVEMPGWVTRESLRKTLTERADIFIQARWRSDMTSLSLSEAMAFGLPSIVPAGGGLQWVAGNSALTFAPDDIDDLARKIEQLGNDAALREKLSRECFVRLHDAEVDYEKTIPELNRILRELTKDSRRII